MCNKSISKRCLFLCSRPGKSALDVQEAHWSKCKSALEQSLKQGLTDRWACHGAAEWLPLQDAERAIRTHGERAQPLVDAIYLICPVMPILIRSLDSGRRALFESRWHDAFQGSSHVVV